MENERWEVMKSESPMPKLIFSFFFPASQTLLTRDFWRNFKNCFLWPLGNLKLFLLPHLRSPTIHQQCHAKLLQSKQDNVATKASLTFKGTGGQHGKYPTHSGEEQSPLTIQPTRCYNSISWTRVLGPALC